MHCGIYTYPANLMKILKKYALFKEYGVETKYHFVFLELETLLFLLQITMANYGFIVLAYSQRILTAMGSYPSPIREKNFLSVNANKFIIWHKLYFLFNIFST